MNQLIKIKTARLRKAIDEYFMFNNKYPDTVPVNEHEKYERIKNKLCNASFYENKSCAIVPKCICLGETLKNGKKRFSWVRSVSNYKTPEWEIVEEL